MADDAALPGMDDTRVTGLIVLGLGFVASATAVVPGFDQLMHGNRAYLAVTSLLGLAALIAGVVMLWSASSTALGLLMAVLAVLWVIATTHHVMLTNAQRANQAHEAAPRASSGRHPSMW